MRTKILVPDSSKLVIEDGENDDPQVQTKTVLNT